MLRFIFLKVLEKNYLQLNVSVEINFSTDIIYKAEFLQFFFDANRKKTSFSNTNYIKYNILADYIFYFDMKIK